MKFSNRGPNNTKKIRQNRQQAKLVFENDSDSCDDENISDMCKAMLQGSGTLSNVKNQISDANQNTLSERDE